MKQILFKKSAFILAFLLFCLTFSGCSEKPAVSSTPASQPPSSAVSVSEAAEPPSNTLSLAHGVTLTFLLEDYTPYFSGISTQAYSYKRLIHQGDSLYYITQRGQEFKIQQKHLETGEVKTLYISREYIESFSLAGEHGLYVTEYLYEERFYYDKETFIFHYDTQTGGKTNIHEYLELPADLSPRRIFEAEGFTFLLCNSTVLGEPSALYRIDTDGIHTKVEENTRVLINGRNAYSYSREDRLFRVLPEGENSWVPLIQMELPKDVEGSSVWFYMFDNQLVLTLTFHRLPKGEPRKYIYVVDLETKTIAEPILCTPIHVEKDFYVDFNYVTTPDAGEPDSDTGEEDSASHLFRLIQYDMQGNVLQEFQPFPDFVNIDDIIYDKDFVIVGSDVYYLHITYEPERIELCKLGE